MSLDLNCPNCGAKVGDVEYGVKTYYYINEKGIPDCCNCNTNNAIAIEKKLPIIFIGIILAYIVLLILI